MHCHVIPVYDDRDVTEYEYIIWIEKITFEKMKRCVKEADINAEIFIIIQCNLYT